MVDLMAERLVEMLAALKADLSVEKLVVYLAEKLVALLAEMLVGLLVVE